MVLPIRIARPFTAAVAAASIALVAAGGVAVATDAPAEQITACVDNKSSVMRLATETKPCSPKNEALLTWNKQGVPGVRGEDGQDADPAVTDALAERLDALEADAKVINVFTTHSEQQEVDPRTTSTVCDFVQQPWTCRGESYTRAAWSEIGWVDIRVETTSYPNGSACFPLHLVQHVTAPDGELVIESDGPYCRLADSNVYRATLDSTVTSGTGRYAGATGSMHAVSYSEVWTGSDGNHSKLLSATNYGTLVLQ